MAAEAIYHERQSLLKCGIHSVNNFLQRQAYTQEEIDKICSRLTPDAFINPHKSVFGLGDYDINVLMTALQESGFESHWYDARKDLSSINEAVIAGILINVTRKKLLLFNMGFKHWYPIRPINGQWWNLDSKLDAPELIDDFREYLRKILTEPLTQLILLTTSDVTKEQVYLNLEST